MSDKTEGASAGAPRLCPYCYVEVHPDATICRHCRATITTAVDFKPEHGGTCPLCRESIDPRAIRCPHCQSNLFEVEGDETTPDVLARIPTYTFCDACSTGIFGGELGLRHCRTLIAVRDLETGEVEVVEIDSFWEACSPGEGRTFSEGTLKAKRS